MQDFRFIIRLKFQVHSQCKLYSCFYDSEQEQNYFQWTEKCTRHDRPGSWLNLFVYLKNSAECLFIVNNVSNNTIFYRIFFNFLFFFIFFLFFCFRLSLHYGDDLMLICIRVFVSSYEVCYIVYLFLSFFFYRIVNFTLSCFPVLKFDKQA